MKSLRIIPTLFLLGLITTVFLAGCGKEPRRASASKKDLPSLAHPASTPNKKILYWMSPMMPGYRSKTPGKDSMGMELVPVYAGKEAEEPGTVRIDPATVQNIGVKTVVLRSEVLSREIRTVGRVAYDDRAVRNIAPKISGWVERQYVNFEGQTVERGEPLVRIYSPELVSTQEEYLSVLGFERQMHQSPIDELVRDSKNLVASAEARLRYWDIPEAQIAALRKRGEITRTMLLQSPFKGIVLRKDVSEGGYVKAGQSLYALADISTVWVNADIYEYEAPWLKLEQQATMSLAYEPGTSYTGRVIYIYPYLNEKTRTLRVRMTFRNTRDFKLKPGMWADVTLKSTLSHEGVAIPVEAVIRTGRRNIALLALGGGYFAPREIKLGPQSGGKFEVLCCLKAGDRVVDSAEFLINSESNLRSALGKMSWQEPPLSAASETSASGSSALTSPSPAMTGAAPQPAEHRRSLNPPRSGREVNP